MEKKKWVGGPKKNKNKKLVGALTAFYNIFDEYKRKDKYLIFLSFHGDLIYSTIQKKVLI